MNSSTSFSASARAWFLRARYAIFATVIWCAATTFGHSGLALMSSKLRIGSVLLLATLMVVAGSSVLVPKGNANGVFTLTLTSRHEAGVCSNLGTIVFNRVTYALPTTLQLQLDTSYSAIFNSVPGCDFVRWEKEGELGIMAPQNPSTPVTTPIQSGSAILRVIYRGTCCSVGGVVTPTNPLIALAPYLAMICLVATAAVAVKRKLVY